MFYNMKTMFSLFKTCVAAAAGASQQTELPWSPPEPRTMSDKVLAKISENIWGLP